MTRARFKDELLKLLDVTKQPVDFLRYVAIVHVASSPANAAFNRASLANA